MTLIKKQSKAIIFLVCVAVAGLAYFAHAAGTLSRTRQDYKTIKRDVYTWAITGGTGLTNTMTNFSYEILRVVIPGQAAATNSLDLYIYDAQSVDVLSGSGATISNATINLFADHADTVLPIAVSGDLSLVITNANVDVTTGTIVIYGR